MASPIAAAAHLVGQAARVGWYFGLTRLMETRARYSGSTHRSSTTMPVPALRELLADIGGLAMSDAALVRDGVLPPLIDEARRPLDHLDRVGAMLADLPSSVRRREAKDFTGARHLPEAAGLPEYYTRDFHYQTGGYLTEESARLYDVQVETLFLGAGALMRRAALAPIIAHLRGRDQRRCRLLDVACGTGRLLRYVRLALPAMRLTGLDLSRAYLDEAKIHLGDLRAVDWLQANAEAMPLDDASQDIVTSVFLFHELPPEVRRTVAGEMARLLEPGGRLVFMDSLQLGDRPDWDGLLETFPQRCHEPFYRHYASDDLVSLFADAGLTLREKRHVLLAKMLVFER